MKRSPLKRISDRRLVETTFYLYRIRQFLLAHPYCQVWLRENGIAEESAIEAGGLVSLPEGRIVAAPLATQVHHVNKRRGADLLDQAHWLAVSALAHRRIEDNKAWARLRGYLLHF